MMYDHFHDSAGKMSRVPLGAVMAGMYRSLLVCICVKYSAEAKSLSMYISILSAGIILTLAFYRASEKIIP